MPTAQEWIRSGRTAFHADSKNLSDINQRYPYSFCFTVLDATVHHEPLTIINHQNEIRVACPLDQLHPQYSHWHQIMTEFNMDNPKNRKLKMGILGLFNFVQTNWHVMYDLDKMTGQEVRLVFDYHDAPSNHLLKHNQFFIWLQQIGKVGRDAIPFGPTGPSITFVVTQEIIEHFKMFAGGFGTQRFNMEELRKSFDDVGLKY
jgi:hypothetical protein